MSVGFQFTATISSQNLFLKTLQELAAKFHYAYCSGEDWACVNFCRMGDLHFSFKAKRKTVLGSIALTTECTSTPCGAGFHAAAIDFTDALIEGASLKIRMNDETGYFVHRDFLRMREDHFYSWLSTIVAFCRNEGEKSSLSNFCICWDPEQYIPVDIPGTVVTPFGRLHIDKLVDQVENEGIEAFACEFFLWNERERNGRFYLNSALSFLWEDCFFMPGSRSEKDARANDTIIGLLEHAAALDDSLPMPKPEYALLCRLENHAPMDLLAFSDYEPDYLLGYRRHKVLYRMGNTSIPIPGHFLQSDEDGYTLWYDGNDTDWRNLRATALRIREGEAEFSSRLFEHLQGSVSEFKTAEGKGRAAFFGEIRDEDGSVHYQSIAEIICAQQITLLTAAYQRREDAEWAMALFQEVKAFAAMAD